jgi:hypothetical protein
LIGSTDARPLPCKTIPAYSNEALYYAIGVVLAKPGRISALAPLALTGVFLNLNSDPSQSDITAVVTTFTFKATLFRAVGPGRGGFSGGRRGVRLRSVLGVDVGEVF